MRTSTMILLAGGAFLAYKAMAMANAAKLLRVSFKGLRVSRVDVTSVRLLLTLNIYNPSNTSLSFDRLYAQVNLNGTYLAEVDVFGNAAQVVKPVGDTSVEVPVVLQNFSAATTIYSLIMKLAAGQKITDLFEFKGFVVTNGITIPITANMRLDQLGIGRVNGIADCFQCLL